LEFKNGQFSKIIKIVGSIWQKFEKDCTSRNILIAHFWFYKENKYPYNASYVQGHDIPITWWNSIELIPNYLQELALKILAIVPNKDEDLDKDEFLLSNDLDNNETNTITKNDLVLFLETSLDLNDEIFIDDLEQFPDDDDENAD
ncbi:ribonuclease H-like domain-containing protein, partial [Gigaspora margarita]